MPFRRKLQAKWVSNILCCKTVYHLVYITVLLLFYAVEESSEDEGEDSIQQSADPSASKLS